MRDRREKWRIEPWYAYIWEDYAVAIVLCLIVGAGGLGLLAGYYKGVVDGARAMGDLMEQTLEECVNEGKLKEPDDLRAFGDALKEAGRELKGE